MANDDASRQETRSCGCPQSNLWFGRWDDLRGFGPAGRLGRAVGRTTRSRPTSPPSRFCSPVSSAASSTWPTTARSRSPSHWKLTRPATATGPSCVGHRAGPRLRLPRIPAGTAGEWIRLKTDRDVRIGDGLFPLLLRVIAAADPSLLRQPAAAGRQTRQSEGILQSAAGATMPLGFAATVIDESPARPRKPATTCWAKTCGSAARRRRGREELAHELGAAARLRGGRRVGHHAEPRRPPLSPAQGRRDVFSRPAASGWRRGIREVVTERNLMNIHGTFYEMPRREAGGLAKIRPSPPTTAGSSTSPPGAACWCSPAT